MTVRASTAALACVLALALPARAHAYSEMDRFDQSPETGGGGGRRFTGAPADGFTCAVCHDDGGAAEIVITGVPERGYEPLARYAIEVAWPEATGDAALALEVASPSGSDPGGLELPLPAELSDDERCRAVGADPPLPATRLFDALGGRTVLGTDSCGAARARVEWTAPPSGGGTVWLHATSVFSNASGSNRGDRVAVVARPIVEEGTPPPELSVVEGGCSPGGRGRAPAPWALVLAFFLVVGGRRRQRARALAATVAIAALFQSGHAHAVPGPDSTAVLANANEPESVALAERYRAARDIPARQVCALPIDAVADLSLASFRAQVEEPLARCLEDSGVLERIEAIVIVRGAPLRVTVPTAGGGQRVSLAAALGVWRSTVDGAPLLGQEPGASVPCGGGATCYAARFQNPFRSGAFEPGWTRTSGAIEWEPMLVTMLHGRSYEDAGMLIDSALASEGSDASTAGEMQLMDGADPARGALDFEYDRVVSELTARGVTAATRVPFAADETGHTFAAFFTGTASIGETIEGNDFTPGAIVDNLTSFGAVPTNFDPSGESQVSIARWVARGVAGVHGTTDEPLNSVFPSRYAIVDYVDGSTLAEAFHRRLPNVYWRNLVLGDPMTAPYAVRPIVTIDGVASGGSVADARTITVHAIDPEAIGVGSLVLYLDGVEVARADGDTLVHCIHADEAREVQLLAVAQKRDDGSPRGLHQPKGWTALGVIGGPGTLTCEAETDGGATSADAGLGDGGTTDAGAGPPPPDDGCGCAVPGEAPRSPGGALVVLASLGLLLRGGTRRRA